MLAEALQLELIPDAISPSGTIESSRSLFTGNNSRAEREILNLRPELCQPTVIGDEVQPDQIVQPNGATEHRWSSERKTFSIAEAEARSQCRRGEGFHQELLAAM